MDRHVPGNPSAASSGSCVRRSSHRSIVGATSGPRTHQRQVPADGGALEHQGRGQACRAHRARGDRHFRRGFADLIGGDDAALAAEAVPDPEQTVRVDVELVRSATVLPATFTVSGHVYDVTTGLVTTVLPAAPMHAAVPVAQA